MTVAFLGMVYYTLIKQSEANVKATAAQRALELAALEAKASPAQTPSPIRH